MKIDILNLDSNSLLEKIFKYKKERNIKNSSLLELIEDFCEKNDLSFEEVGYTLSENKEFVIELEKEAFNLKLIKNPKYYKKKDSKIEDF